MQRKTPRKRRRPFPILHVIGVLAAVWGSMWLSGMAGARIGMHLYETRVAPEAPYTDEQLRSMERASPEAAAVARQDLHVWTETFSMGQSIARVEGALAGTLLMLAVWGTLAAVWLFGRERDRDTRPRLDGFAEI